MLDLRAQYAAIGGEVRAALDEVLASQQFVLGPQLSALEHELAQYGGRKYGIGVASGTDALILGLRACGVKPGDEVIVPAFTFIASAGAVSALGAAPVFADSDAETLNVDPASVASRLTKRTAAIVVVHLYGLPADLEALGKIASRRGIPLIEDNAQALGSRYHGRPAGSFGTVSATSFYPSKNLGAYGDAGMILTDSKEIAGRLAILRNHGQTGTYVSSEPGWNSRLDEMQAAVLRVKLRYLDKWIARRRVLAARYDEGLAAVAGIMPLSVPAGREHTYYLYTVRVADEGPRPGARRDGLRESLAKQGIGSGVYYPVPLHLQPVFASSGASSGGKAGALPVAEQAAHEVLSLPIYPEMTVEQVDRVVYAVAETLRRGRNTLRRNEVERLSRGAGTTACTGREATRTR
jgi:dTDP-4-amino-4,6-dideoxygalactose transaminase